VFSVIFLYLLATPGKQTDMRGNLADENSEMERLVGPGGRGYRVFFGKSAQGEERKGDEMDTENERVRKWLKTK
jgi:hypothetical protein